MDAIYDQNFWLSIATALAPFVLVFVGVGIWQTIDDYKSGLEASMRRHPAGKGRKS